MKTLRVATETALEKHVLRWIHQQAADYETGAEGVLQDLSQGGCQSGMVGHLIYYTDTTAFYRTHKKAINALLVDVLQDTGCTPETLFGDKWDRDDPLALDTQNQNLLAWFGFEEAAQRLAARAGLEL